MRVLYDERALYVGITALDSEPAQIRRPLVRNDQVNRTQDFVVVYIDAIGQRRSAQFFRVNAAGSTADGMHPAADDREDFLAALDAAVIDNAPGAADARIAAVADQKDLRDIQAVSVMVARDRQLTLLFDPGKTLEERIFAEQFQF